MSEIERELSWDDTIENDSADFVVLPEGDYDFEVVGFERGRYAGGDKPPACNKAVISIKVFGNNGDTTTINHNLFLHSKTEGMLCAFFIGIGQRKKGEKLSMNWNTVVGSRGRCKLKVKNWTGTTGDVMQNNEITKFYEPAETGAGGYTPGVF